MTAVSIRKGHVWPLILLLCLILRAHAAHANTVVLSGTVTERSSPIFSVGDTFVLSVTYDPELSQPDSMPSDPVNGVYFGGVVRSRVTFSNGLAWAFDGFPNPDPDGDPLPGGSIWVSNYPADYR